MQTDLTWKKELFSSTYSIFSRSGQSGSLTERPFSQSAHGELNGKRYTFLTKGIFKQRTEILDREKKRVIGEINYNSMMTRATISLESGTIHWKYENIRNTKWRMYGPEGIEIRYKGSFGGGQIVSNTEDEVLLLSGLFVTNYYWQFLSPSGFQLLPNPHPLWTKSILPSFYCLQFYCRVVIPVKNSMQILNPISSSSSLMILA